MFQIGKCIRRKRDPFPAQNNMAAAAGTDLRIHLSKRRCRSPRIASTLRRLRQPDHGKHSARLRYGGFRNPADHHAIIPPDLLFVLQDPTLIWFQ